MANTTVVVAMTGGERRFASTTPLNSSPTNPAGTVASGTPRATLASVSRRLSNTLRHQAALMVRRSWRKYTTISEQLTQVHRHVERQTLIRPARQVRQ